MKQELIRCPKSRPRGVTEEENFQLSSQNDLIK